MSPLFILILLLVVIGLVAFVVGLFKKRMNLVVLGGPGAVFAILWLVLSSAPPRSEQEFDRLFGEENRSRVSQIDTTKPIMMDGHFVSFRISKVDYYELISPQFESVVYTDFHLLRGQKLPSGWPQSIEDSASGLYREIDGQDVLVDYDERAETAYVSVFYEQW